MEKDRFIAYIEFEKRYSPNTITAYRNDLEQFYTFLHFRYEIESIQQVNHTIIRSWLVHLMEEKLSARSVNRKLTTLKSFYKFMLREGLVDTNPLRKINAPKTSKRLPVFIEKEKMETILNPVNFGKGFADCRDQLILELFYATGIRLSELIYLKESDIDFYHSTIKVLGKRNKERLIPFSHRLRIILENYLHAKSSLKQREEKILEESGFLCQNCVGTISSDLFITNSGRKIYPKFIYRIVHSKLENLTTLNKKSPHVLRHTFATHLLNNGAELNAVKELLGHANLAATQVYTHNTIDKLKRIYQQAHPKA